jgi:hypothetical protein
MIQHREKPSEFRKRSRESLEEPSWGQHYILVGIFL